MAQDIEIANAQYNDVPSIEVPKQGGGTAVFTDTADADAVADDIAEGKTAYVNGIKLTGTGTGGGGNYVTTDTDQNVTGTKTFVGSKKVGFKQSANSDKLGFTLYMANNTERGYLEFNPTNTIDSVAGLMTLGNYATSANAVTHVGFRRYSNVSGANGAYNILTPLIADAKSPFSLTTTYTNFYLPLGITDGTTMVKTDKRGVLDISSLLPSLPTASANTLGGVKVGDGLSIDANGVLSASGGTSYSETVLFSSASGVGSGTINLSGNIGDYHLISIACRNDNTVENMNIFLSSFLLEKLGNTSVADGIVVIRYHESRTNIAVTNNSTLTILETFNNKITKVVGIKFGSTNSQLEQRIAELEAKVAALESQ